jgi:hypothetical protein
LQLVHFNIEKKSLPVLKIQNGGCIQDGVKSFFYFSSNIFKNDYLSISLFLFILGKNKTFMGKLFLEISKWWNNYLT